MCNPMVIGLASLAAGTGAQMYGQNRAERATDRYTNQVRSAENDRQDDLRKKRMAELQTALDSAGVESARKRMSEGEQEALDSYDEVDSRAEEARGYSSNPAARGGGPQVVQAEFDRESEGAAEDLAQTAGARARLGSFNDATLSRALELQPIQQRISMNNNFARGSAGVLPYELQDAVRRGQRKGRGVRMVGDLLSTVGQGALTYGAFGAGGAGAVPNMQGQSAPLLDNSAYMSMY